MDYCTGHSLAPPLYRLKVGRATLDGMISDRFTWCQIGVQGSTVPSHSPTSSTPENPATVTARDMGAQSMRDSNRSNKSNSNNKDNDDNSDSEA
jgi:hypothetical protein